MALEIIFTGHGTSISPLVESQPNLATCNFRHPEKHVFKETGAGNNLDGKSTYFQLRQHYDMLLNKLQNNQLIENVIRGVADGVQGNFRTTLFLKVKHFFKDELFGENYLFPKDRLLVHEEFSVFNYSIKPLTWIAVIIDIDALHHTQEKITATLQTTFPLDYGYNPVVSCVVTGNIKTAVYEKSFHFNEQMEQIQDRSIKGNPLIKVTDSLVHNLFRAGKHKRSCLIQDNLVLPLSMFGQLPKLAMARVVQKKEKEEKIKLKERIISRSANKLKLIKKIKAELITLEMSVDDDSNVEQLNASVDNLIILINEEKLKVDALDACINAIIECEIKIVENFNDHIHKKIKHIINSSFQHRSSEEMTCQASGFLTDLKGKLQSEALKIEVSLAEATFSFNNISKRKRTEKIKNIDQCIQSAHKYNLLARVFWVFSNDISEDKFGIKELIDKKRALEAEGLVINDHKAALVDTNRYKELYDSALKYNDILTEVEKIEGRNFNSVKAELSSLKETISAIEVIKKHISSDLFEMSRKIDISLTVEAAERQERLANQVLDYLFFIIDKRHSLKLSDEVLLTCEQSFFISGSDDLEINKSKFEQFNAHNFHEFINEFCSLRLSLHNEIIRQEYDKEAYAEYRACLGKLAEADLAYRYFRYEYPYVVSSVIRDNKLLNPHQFLEKIITSLVNRLAFEETFTTKMRSAAGGETPDMACMQRQAIALGQTFLAENKGYLPLFEIEKILEHIQISQPSQEAIEDGPCPVVCNPRMV